MTATFARRRASASNTAFMKAVVPMLTEVTSDGVVAADLRTSRIAFSMPLETSVVVGAL